MSHIPQRPFSVDVNEYPFESRWLEQDGTFMHYIDEGEGLPVILLHGNPAWSFLYRKVIKHLDGTCRAIAPDYPGFGMSQHPTDYGYTPQEHAKWVTSLIDHLKLDRFIIVVQDWGGPIGMSIAVERPDHVAGLVISNTWSWKPEYLIWKVFSTIFGSPVGKYLIFQQNFLNKRMLPGMFAKSDAHVLKAYNDPFPTPESRIGMYVFIKSLARSDQWLSTIESQLHRLTDKPVELIFGLNDPFFANESIVNRWQKHFPNAGLDKLPNAGHFLEEDTPEQIASAIKRVIERQEMSL